MRLLAEPSGIGRWRRRATGAADRWSPSCKGYRTRLTVRPRPTAAKFNTTRGSMNQSAARGVASHPTIVVLVLGVIASAIGWIYLSGQSQTTEFYPAWTWS